MATLAILAELLDFSSSRRSVKPILTSTRPPFLHSLGRLAVVGVVQELARVTVYLSWKQWAAVRTWRGVTREPPQKFSGVLTPRGINLSVTHLLFVSTKDTMKGN
jgi:hypothetical protein